MDLQKQYSKNILHHSCFSNKSFILYGQVNCIYFIYT